MKKKKQSHEVAAFFYPPFKFFEGTRGDFLESKSPRKHLAYSSNPLVIISAAYGKLLTQAVKSCDHSLRR